MAFVSFEIEVLPLFHFETIFMPKATLTKRIEFCASHRYHNPNWDDEKNRQIFGPCNNKNSHGHNYMLEVTLRGAIDPVTGMIINLYDLKHTLTDILKEFDHKYLNLDTPYFTERIPTTENLALTLWDILGKHPDIPVLDRIRLYEDDTLYTDVTKEGLNGSADSSRMPHADITKQYKFSAAKNLPTGQSTGHNYTVDITINGPVDHDTGQVINIQALDQLVQARVLSRFDKQNLSLDSTFLDSQVSEGNLARFLWEDLESEISQGTLTHITVSEGDDTLATYRHS